MFSALAAVCTVDSAIEIVLITLHYITVIIYQPHLTAGIAVQPQYAGTILGFTAAKGEGGHQLELETCNSSSQISTTTTRIPVTLSALETLRVEALYKSTTFNKNL